MAEIRHLDNRHDVIFFCRGWFDLDKITETGASYDMTRCYNIATRNKKKNKLATGQCKTGTFSAPLQSQLKFEKQ